MVEMGIIPQINSLEKNNPFTGINYKNSRCPTA